MKLLMKMMTMMRKTMKVSSRDDDDDDENNDAMINLMMMVVVITMIAIMMMMSMMFFVQSLWQCSCACLQAAQVQIDRPRQCRPGMEGNCLRAQEIKCRLSSTAGDEGIQSGTHWIT